MHLILDRNPLPQKGYPKKRSGDTPSQGFILPFKNPSENKAENGLLEAPTKPLARPSLEHGGPSTGTSIPAGQGEPTRPATPRLARAPDLSPSLGPWSPRTPANEAMDRPFPSKANG